MNTTGFINNLNNAARENPLAAGLVGLGLAWMLFGKSTAIARATSDAAAAAKDTIDGATDMVSGAAEQARRATARVSEAVSDGVEAATSTIRGAVDTGAQTAEKVGKTSAPLARTFTDLLERQPLAVAAVGAAVGAAIACALPATRAEDRLMGNTAEGLRDSLRESGDVLAERMGAAVEGAIDEAEAQNLTPSAIKEAARAGAAKLKVVGEAAVEAAEKGGPSPSQPGSSASARDYSGPHKA